jgi:hypothetical protein
MNVDGVPLSIEELGIVVTCGRRGCIKLSFASGAPEFWRPLRGDEPLGEDWVSWQGQIYKPLAWRVDA